MGIPGPPSAPPLLMIPSEKALYQLCHFLCDLRPVT